MEALAEFLNNPLHLAIALAVLEAVLRLIPTGKDISLVNNFVDLLTTLFDLIPNKAKSFDKRKSTFSVTSNKIMKGVAKDLIGTNDQNKTLAGTLIQGALNLFKKKI